MSGESKGRVRLDPETWARVELLFHRSTELSPGELGQFLDRECGGDQLLRSEVESLIRSSHVSVEEKLTVVERVGGQLVRRAESAGVGQRIGQWQLLREIGRGGSGIVFLASREADSSPFPRKVAIKLMPVAALSRTTMTRFNNECRILSSLSHRNIARFHESGNTDDGVPFVVMEYVDGVPVDRYCETRQLDVVGRISVFLSICAAVQYAHERRIIHRDLKPGNILVPSNGAPKLLDFGIAKLVRPEQKLTAATTVTSIMTPSYASPEQLRGEKIGTPSDIYSLGLVLYRILTGGLPFGDSERSPADLERLIAEQEPLPPSIRASDESLRGDVDAIILTTLRRNPTERYSSAGVLADDLHRYLTGKPTSVSARG